jgi:hypothetical protein
MGGGEEPPMDQLKNWMYEEWDCNEAGMQSTVPEHSQIDADMIPDFDQFDETVPYTNLPFNIPQEQVQSCDWNNSQYGADLVSASYQFMNGTGGVVDQNLILASHHPQTFCTPYLPRRPHDQNDDDDDDDNDPSVQI